MKKPEPQPQHQWLQKLVGNWTYEAPDPKAPMKGTEVVRSLDGLWIVGEGTGEMPGVGSATMIITLGYNPVTRRFVGTWVGSMMTHLWVYDGFLEGNTLHLDSEGPSMADDGSMAKYRDSIEIVDNDHRILRGQMMKDGQWSVFMETHYRRA